MTQEYLKSLGVTDEDLVRRYEAHTGNKASIGSDRARRNLFDLVSQFDRVGSPKDMDRSGPMMGAFAEDSPDVHASMKVAEPSGSK